MTFDIDANGIVHVNAKDKATGKEQSIRITASSGLSEEEIKQMVRDAEAHADEDHKRREQAEARNQLDSLIFSTEKSLKEGEGKIDASIKSEVENALASAKAKLNSTDAAELKSARDELEAKSHKLAEALYKQAAGQQAGASGAQGGPAGGKSSDPNVVDAEFEDGK